MKLGGNILIYEVKQIRIWKKKYLKEKQGGRCFYNIWWYKNIKTTSLLPHGIYLYTVICISLLILVRCCFQFYLDSSILSFTFYITISSRICSFSLRYLVVQPFTLLKNAISAVCNLLFTLIKYSCRIFLNFFHLHLLHWSLASSC